MDFVPYDVHILIKEKMEVFPDYFVVYVGNDCGYKPVYINTCLWALMIIASYKYCNGTLNMLIMQNLAYSGAIFTCLSDLSSICAS